MITKERLEELIEQGTTIYEAKYNDVVPVSLTNEINCISYRYGMIAFKPMRKHKWLNHKYFKNLFETEDEAREHLEFGNITRTEKLTLPSWEEFKKVSTFTFKRKDGTDMEIAIWHSCPDDDCKTIKITRSYDWTACCFEKPLTRENYNEARRLCIKLFKGEEV